MIEPIKNAVKPAISRVSGARTLRSARLVLAVLAEEAEEDKKIDDIRARSLEDVDGNQEAEAAWLVGDEKGYEAEARRRTLPETVVNVRLEG